MLAQTDYAKALIHDCHRYGWPPRHQGFQELVIMTGKNQHAVTLQTHKVVVIGAGRAIHLELVRCFFHHLHV